jgi:hypothetical protein
MEKIFRITWGGYYDCKAKTEKEAEKQFVNYIENEEIDSYGRDWKELIEVEELDD